MEATPNAVRFASSHDKSLDFIARYTSFSKSNGESSTSKSFVAMESLATQLDFEDDVFCTESNLEQRLKFMNEEVTSHGFSRFLDENGKLELPPLINCMHELLYRQAKQRQAKEETEAKQIRLDSDNDYLVQSISKLKDNYESAQREICLLKLKEKQALTRCNALQLELKTEREEMKRMRSDMHHKMKQFLHESRRNEKEVTKLKERLHQAISTKAQSKMGFEVMSTLSKTTAKRSTWGGKNGDEMHRLIMHSHEDRKRELIAENLKLRSYVSELQTKLMGLIQSGAVDENGNNSLAADSDEENADPAAKRQKKATCSLNRHLEMPFELSKQEIDKEFEVLWQALKSRLDQLNTQGGDSVSKEDNKETANFMSSEVRILKQQLTEYKELVEKQEMVLKTVYDDQLLAKLETSLKADVSPGAQNDFQTRLHLLKQERKNFESEKERFTEYALNLCQEREAFEKERVEFYRHCISTPILAKDSQKHIDKSGDKTSFTGSTPSRRIAEIKGTGSPSTAELYKFMSMATTSDSSKAHLQDGRKLNGSYIEDASGMRSTHPTDRSHRHDEHFNNVRKAVEDRQHKTSPDK